jgi:hypothetical protein
MTLFLIGLQGMRSMNSKKKHRISAWIKQEYYEEIETCRKIHGLKSWTEALHLNHEENLQKIKELEVRIVELEKEPNALSSWLKEKGISIDELLEHKETSAGQVAGRDSMEFSEKACWALVYVKKNPICGDPDAPISPYLKRHLNLQICALCQKLKKKKLEAEEQKKAEEKRKMLEEVRRKAKEAQKRVDKTLKEQENFGGEPRVNWNPPNSKTKSGFYVKADRDDFY